MKALKILFVCRHNRCRSVIAEAIANQLSSGRILARSFGVEPAAAVHPATLRHLADYGYDASVLSCNGWAGLLDFEPDAVITVCDEIASTSLPPDVQAPVQVHWGLRDPCDLGGDFALQVATVRAIVATLERRVKLLLFNHVDRLRGEALRERLVRLGGASASASLALDKRERREPALVH
jgi:arsenate reductase